MRRWVYIAGATKPRDDRPRCIVEMAHIMLKSLGRHSDCTLQCCWAGVDSIAQPFADSFNGNIIFKEIAEPDWNSGVEIDQFKISHVSHCHFEDGDEIIILDVDGIVTGDVFDAFRYSFDMAFTQRATWIGHLPVNTGFIALRWSDVVRRFLAQWLSEIANPTFEPYKALLDTYKNVGNHICYGQDYICAFLSHGTITGGKIAVLPSEFNWFPSEAVLENEKKTRSQYMSAVANPKNYFVHFKGTDSNLMKTCWEAL